MKIALSLKQASTQFGVSFETIRRGLVANEVEKKKTYTIREIHNAIAGDLKAARTRETLANAIARERENRVAEGELIPLSDNLDWQERVLRPIRQRLLALPGTMGQRCNPVDPAFAMAALEEWVKATLPILRREIAKGTK